jgi:predicted HTH domain antitoxin
MAEIEKRMGARYPKRVKAIQIEYPESWTAVMNTTAEGFERDARMALAAKLFEVGRLTSGQAAQLAGIPRVTFLLNCAAWGVPSVSWDAGEIEAEFRTSAL